MNPAGKVLGYLLQTRGISLPGVGDGHGCAVLRQPPGHRSAEPADLVPYVATVVRGMAVLTTGGTSRTKLRWTVELAMRAWPR